MPSASNYIHTKTRLKWVGKLLCVVAKNIYVSVQQRAHFRKGKLSENVTEPIAMDR